MPKHNGRPTKKELWKAAIAYGVTKMSSESVQKLGQAFAIGATVDEACDYADIAPRTFYNWQEKNSDLMQYFSRMRQRLPLKAKTNIAESIHNKDIGLSRWLVERRQPGEYGETIKLDHSGETSSDEDRAITERYHAELSATRLKRSKEKAIKDGEL